MQGGEEQAVALPALVLDVVGEVRLRASPG
jgi:hypothetical protein